VTRYDIVIEARRWIGTPYQHQASLLRVGCDCLGLVRGVWRGLYGTEPETPPAYLPDWAEAGGRETLADAASRHMTAIAPRLARPGDVLLFRWRALLPAKHAAIMTTSRHMIHAHDNMAVCEVPLNEWWRRRLVFAFSFPGVTD
jgi:NlpC/P60 family putative phage cell wall peptidase